MKYIPAYRSFISYCLNVLKEFFIGDYDLYFWYRRGFNNFWISVLFLTTSLLFLPFVYLLGYYQDMMNGVIWGEKQPPPHGRFQKRVWSGTFVLIGGLIYFLLWVTIPSIISIFYPLVGALALILSLLAMAFFFPAVWLMFNHDKKFREHEAITIQRLLWNRQYLSQYPRIISMAIFGFTVSAVTVTTIATISVVTPLTVEQLRPLVIALSLPVSYIATTQVLYGIAKATRNTLVVRRGSYYQNDSRPEWMEDE